MPFRRDSVRNVQISVRLFQQPAKWRRIYFLGLALRSSPIHGLDHWVRRADAGTGQCDKHHPERKFRFYLDARRTGWGKCRKRLLHFWKRNIGYYDHARRLSDQWRFWQQYGEARNNEQCAGGHGLLCAIQYGL